MGRGAKTTLFLMECMADALIKLMESKPLEKISVTEITELAGVGRVTWFRNFSSKSEALTFKLVQLWHRYTEEHALERKSNYTARVAADFFRFSYEIRDLFRLLFNTGMQICIYDAFYQIMMTQKEENIVESYQRRFYSYGLFGLLIEWHKRDYAETPAEMARIFHHLLGSWRAI